MALDEPQKDDEVLDAGGFRLLVDKKLLEQAGGIEVDYLTGPFRKGLQVTAKNQAAFGC